MKKALLIGLVATFVFAFAATAFAVAPSVIDPATGASAWSYQDLHDAGAKYEGGYAAFDNSGETTYSVNPHGGYNTTTNKCKVCHAVHRAEGAYYLLRADSQDDACSYCHIGSAHSTKIVYDLNVDGIYTMNGHTIGAQAQIPDSTILQEAQAVVLSTTDANGDPVTETIHVRGYDSEKNEMFRFARHHGQAAVSFNAPAGFAGGVNSSSRNGYQRIGPLALRCMSCHQPHNAVNEVWRPRVFGTFTSATYATAVDGAFDPDGYKLLRRSPSATVIGNPYFTSASDPTEYWGANQVVKAIEDSATSGVNFSQEESGEKTYVENGVTRSQPVWIAQDIHAEGSGADTGIYRYPNKVNTMAVSWWCADCHNLNIGGWEPLTDPELGFKAHTERTHPAPFYGAYTGPGQCYSCHRNNLAPQMGLAAASDPTSSTIGGVARRAAMYVGRESCTQCHYGTSDYYQERTSTYAEKLDFPHSGAATDIKLLGSYNVSNTSATGGWTPRYNAATITPTTLDQVCLRCHPGIGVNH
ncbi:MAG: hypothetical protein Q8K99_01790 [Actinomycetota bacterium]|nr:hypothetical protein [Actinomycetota bacterium]